MPKITDGPSSDNADIISISKLLPSRYPIRSVYSPYVIFHDIPEREHVNMPALNACWDNKLPLVDLYGCSIA